MKTWARQPHETLKAFEAFQYYLEMGSGRTLAAVGRKLGKSTTLIERWSSRWNWVERTRAYADHMAGARDKAELKAVESEAERWTRRRSELREKEHEMALRLIRRAEEMLYFPITRQTLKDENKIIEPAKWSAADITRYLETASRLARLSAEMETSREGKIIDITERAKDALQKLREEFPELSATKAREWIGKDFGVAPEILNGGDSEN